ncbi:MAG: GNAT family N-acetyltransferase [Acidimicrobiales bacterium]|jgi:acetyl coenzyme A synthetase (ADP forming)-like protein
MNADTSRSDAEPPYWISPAQQPAGYPIDLEADVLLSDGRAATIRPIVPADSELIRSLHASLSDETIYFRFFSFHRTLSESELEHFAGVDYLDRLALVAFVDGELVGVARYDRPPGRDEAEVAFTVRDDQQHRGLGTILLEHLASAARPRGIRRFVADTLSENAKMLGVFRGAGFAERATFEAGVVRVTMELDPVPAYLAKVEERDRVSAVRSIERLMRPASIAVIGASRRPKTIGHELLVNLTTGGFTGRLYPVNPAGGEIAGLQAYASMSEIPEVVDLAVIAVPAAGVLDVVSDCGRSGVGGLVVISAGFAETGEAGRKAERRLVEMARWFGMRVVGPNCMGIVNTAPDISMNATFSPVAPVRGSLGFSSQSGGLGIAILSEATHRDLGVSSFVSVGNKIDVSGNDLLRYWEEDAATSVILMYLESFGNPRHFARISRRISRKKPIIAVKAGRSTSGSRGASSHTAAMATPDAAVDALFRQAGVIRVETLEELFDVADVLSHQPLPKGPRVAIVGNAGGPGVLAADACEGFGLSVPELSVETQQQLRAILSPEAAVTNPVDCIASATADDYRRALELVLADEAVDAVIVIFTPPLVTEAEDVAAAVVAVAATADKPILANFLTSMGTLQALRAGDKRVPWFAYPESAARALGRIVPYTAWRERPEEEPPELDGIDLRAGRALVAAALGRQEAESGVWLSAGETSELLGAYGVPIVQSLRATSAAEAVAAAARLGVPVALKLDVPGVVHKTDVGGVHLGLSSPEEVSSAAAELLERFGEGAAVILQPMVEAGIETICGLVEDPAFGPLVMFGLGGTATEVLGDRALSLVPLGRSEADRLISSLKSAPLLRGYRGAEPADTDALADLLCRVARLAEDVPEIVEMDLNPVVAWPRGKGCVAIDAKIRLAPPAVPEPMLRRRHLR